MEFLPAHERLVTVSIFGKSSDSSRVNNNAYGRRIGAKKQVLLW